MALSTNSDDEIGVDFIGKFESLREDWEYICDRMAVTSELAHYRKVKHKPYEYYYTPETWDLVGKLYEQDINLFGYGDA